MGFPHIVTRDEWLAARQELLAKEKAFDHERDTLTNARRQLPMVRVEKPYVFDGPRGSPSWLDDRKTLSKPYEFGSRIVHNPPQS